MVRNIVTLLLTESAPTKDKPYREAIGILLYFATCSLPDISFDVGVVALHCEAPSLVHWSIVNRIFPYLQGTQNLALKYIKRNPHDGFVSYSGSDWAGRPCHKSTTGSLYF